MAISFPSNPTVGQQYTASNITWEWNGSSWASLPPSSGIGLTNLSVTQSAVGTAALSYDNSSGAFSYTPPDLSSYLTSYTETDTLSSVTGRGATTNTSLTFGGSLTVAGSANVSLDSGNLSLGSGGIQAPSSSQNLNWGSGNFYFNSGSPEIGWSNGSGTLRTLSSSGAISIKGGSPAENLGVFKTGGAVELYYDNTKKLETTGVGVTVFGTTQTQQLNVTGVSTFNGAVDVTANVEFKAAAGNSSLYMYDENAINLGSQNDGRLVYNNSGNIVKFERAGSAGEIEIDATPVTLKNSDSIRLQTTAYGISVDQSIAGYAYLQAPFWKQPNGSMVTINVTVATKTQEHRYNGSGSGNGYLLNGVQAPFLTLTPGRSYRFLNTNTGSHPLKFYLEADRTTLYSTGVTFNNAYTEIAISDTTPQVLHYQCTNHAYMGNAVYTNSNKLQTPYTVSVGSGSSTNGIDSPTLTLSHNNPTVVGTAGTTGQVKQIGGQPYYYDGTAWRAPVSYTHLTLPTTPYV